MDTITTESLYALDTGAHAPTMTLQIDDSTFEVPNEVLEFSTPRENGGAKTLNALLRAVHQLGGLCDEMRTADDSAFAYASTAYQSIHDRIVDLVDTEIGAELRRLTGNGRPAISWAELRLASVQLHAWTQHVVTDLETQRTAEWALNASFAALAASATTEVQNNTTYPTGLYL